ncbi:MAG TPA: hypothetical protein VMZ91_13070 [Candidatus Paceibacterota bacterium]|nr:hypothetical protein [Candidatus Paceibacterota bacterium]
MKLREIIKEKFKNRDQLMSKDFIHADDFKKYFKKLVAEANKRGIGVHPFHGKKLEDTITIAKLENGKAKIELWYDDDIGSSRIANLDIDYK